MTDGTNHSHTLTLTEGETRLAEAHRGFVREMDHHLGQAYGFGGAAVVAVFVGLLAAGWFLGLLMSALLWVPGITACLLTLFVARQRIYRRRDRLRDRVERYCEVNGIEVELLRDYYGSEQVYSFFAAIFEEAPGPVTVDRPAAEH
jgi:hypothetical protein